MEFGTKHTKNMYTTHRPTQELICTTLLAKWELLGFFFSKFVVFIFPLNFRSSYTAFLSSRYLTSNIQRNRNRSCGLFVPRVKDMMH
jgi:hypothetical protein